LIENSFSNFTGLACVIQEVSERVGKERK
jgi:hypothetical protein